MQSLSAKESKFFCKYIQSGSLESGDDGPRPEHRLFFRGAVWVAWGWGGRGGGGSILAPVTWSPRGFLVYLLRPQAHTLQYKSYAHGLLICLFFLVQKHVVG